MEPRNPSSLMPGATIQTKMSRIQTQMPSCSAGLRQRPPRASRACTSDTPRASLLESTWRRTVCSSACYLYDSIAKGGTPPYSEPLRFRHNCLGFRPKCLGFRPKCRGIRPQCLRFRPQCLRFRLICLGFRSKYLGLRSVLDSDSNSSYS